MASIEIPQRGSQSETGSCTGAPAAAPAAYDSRYAFWALAIIFCINLSNYMDRFIVSILVEPVKREFGLSDAQAGLLTGLGFAFVYSLLILPVGRLSDRYSRKKILTGAIALWSLMSALCGAASNFVMLLLARAAVGVGEAAGVPAIHSMTSDIFPAKKRPMALSVMGLGGAVGATLGLLIGGLISQYYGWRWAFLSAASPGFLLALVVALFLREPARGQSDGVAAQAQQPARGFWPTVRMLCVRKAYFHVVVGVTLAAVGSMGANAWTPAFFMRIHHVPQAELGLWLTASQALGAFAGSLGGGWVCAKFYRPDGKTLLWVMGTSFLVAPILGLFMVLAPAPHVALMALPAFTLMGSLWMGPFYTAQQELAGVRNRSTASGLGLMCFNLFGAGCGPLIVGVLSDTFDAAGMATPLRYALACSFAFLFLGLVHMLMASRTIGQDIQDARADA
jgi:predicted MFS family arabinose efflux permease